MFLGRSKPINGGQLRHEVRVLLSVLALLGHGRQESLRTVLVRHLPILHDFATVT